jgi:hypothetical protein
MAKKNNDILLNKYFEIKVKDIENGRNEIRVLHISKLIGTKNMGKNGLISIEQHLKLDLEDIFGSKYSHDKILYIKECAETNRITLELGKLDYS